MNKNICYYIKVCGTQFKYSMACPSFSKSIKAHLKSSNVNSCCGVAQKWHAHHLTVILSNVLIYAHSQQNNKESYLGGSPTTSYCWCRAAADIYHVTFFQHKQGMEVTCSTSAPVPF